MKKLKYILPTFIVGLLLGGLLYYGGMKLIPRLQENRNVYDRFTVGEPVTIKRTPNLDFTKGGTVETNQISFFVCTTAKNTTKEDITRICTLSDQYENVFLYYIGDFDLYSLVETTTHFLYIDMADTATPSVPIYFDIFNEKALSPAAYLIVGPDGTLLFKSHDLNKVSDYLAKQ